MNPIAFEIGSMPIRWYGIMAAAGFIAASFIMEKNRKHANLSQDDCGTLLIIALIFGLIGARLFYVTQFFYEKGYSRNLMRIFYLHEGGLVFYGGFILATLAIIFYTRKKKMDTIRVMDIFTPAMAAAHACGRIGCFLNGCCYGRATDSFWGVTAPVGSHLWFETEGKPVHPVQLLEAGENIILCGIFWWMLKKNSPRGVVVSCYFATYGFLRCFNEMLRGDNDLFWKLTPAQWIGIAMICIGSGMLYFFLRKNNEKRT